MVFTLLALVASAVAIAWIGFQTLAGPVDDRAKSDRSEAAAPGVILDKVLYRSLGGDPAIVIAQDVRSGKEIWRTELGAVAGEPTVIVEDTVVEVLVAGTPWMTLDRNSGTPIE